MRAALLIADGLVLAALVGRWSGRRRRSSSARVDNGWRPERVGACDHCHGAGLEVCEIPGEPGTWDLCGPCWRLLGIRAEV